MKTKNKIKSKVKNKGTKKTKRQQKTNERESILRRKKEKARKGYGKNKTRKVKLCIQNKRERFRKT